MFGQWDPRLGLWTDQGSKSIYAKDIGGWVDQSGQWWRGGKMVDPATVDPQTRQSLQQYAQMAGRAFGGGGQMAPQAGPGPQQAPQAPQGRAPAPAPSPRINTSPLPSPSAPTKLGDGLQADPLSAFGKPHPHAPLLVDSFKTLAKSLKEG